MNNNYGVDEIFCAQAFLDDAWRTVYVSCYRPEADEAYDEVLYGLDGPVRLVRFAVDGVDFIATHARDFELIAARG